MQRDQDRQVYNNSQCIITVILDKVTKHSSITLKIWVKYRETPILFKKQIKKINNIFFSGCFCLTSIMESFILKT
jgi:hypothetical protein